ncbi:MAG: hypothetical protein ABI857_01960 [Acidobacteriota bacterium]
MTVTDLLIIYLTFGAPLAVYKYLQNRAIDIRRRIVVSIFTFFFWVPAAVEIGYLYLTNASFEVGFVSRRNSDATDIKLSEMRELVSAQLIKLARVSNLHDLREILDRYAGLADAVRNSIDKTSFGHPIFEAAGREKSALGSLCLMRRNLRQLERHHIQARRDLVFMFGQIGGGGHEALETIEMGKELARQLGDDETVEELHALKVKKGEVWKSEQLEHAQSIAAGPPIVMTASLSND